MRFTACRLPVLAVSLALVSLWANVSSATPAKARPMAAKAAQADEILLDVSYGWKLKGSRISGSLTNSDRSDVTGTAKLTVRSTSRTISVTRVGNVSVAVGHKQVLVLTLTKAGTSYFRRHRTAKAQLVLQETAGTRSGEVSEEVRIGKVK